MSELLAQLQAAQAAQPMHREAGSTAAPVPAEQVEALVQVLRAAVPGQIVTIPQGWWRSADGTGTMPWAPRGNPAQGYAEAVRKVLCKARGGDGTHVWVSQYSALGEAPVEADGTKGKRPIIGAGLEVRSRIPASAKGIPADLAHLVG